MTEPDTSIAHWASLVAPPLFVLLWASGFIGAKFGLPYAEPMTFLTIRMTLVVGLLGIIVLPQAIRAVIARQKESTSFTMHAPRRNSLARQGPAAAPRGPQSD